MNIHSCGHATKKIWLPLALGTTFFVSIGCGGTSSLAGTIGLKQSRVRAVNAFSGVTAMSGQTGSDSVLTSNVPIAYGTAGSYIITKNESESVALFSGASSSNLLASLSNTLFRINKYYTIVGYGSSSNRQIAIVEDTHTEASSGTANVRFINAVSTVGAVDVYVSAVGASLPNSPSVSSLAVGQATSSPNYLSQVVPLGGQTQIEIRVTPAGNRSSILLDITPVNLSEKDRWSFVLDDPSESTGQTGIGFVKMQDRP